MFVTVEASRSRSPTSQLTMALSASEARASSRSPPADSPQPSPHEVADTLSDLPGSSNTFVLPTSTLGSAHCISAIPAREVNAPPVLSRLNVEEEDDEDNDNDDDNDDWQPVSSNSAAPERGSLASLSSACGNLSALASGSAPASASLPAPRKRKRHLIVVAYQLPVSITRLPPKPAASPVSGSTPSSQDGSPASCRHLEDADACVEWSIQWDDVRSFMSNLRVLNRTMNVTFVGAPGFDVSYEERESLENALAPFHCVPVFLPSEVKDRYYNGCCRGMLWPLFHYVMPHANKNFGTQWDSMWHAYTSVNMLVSSHLLLSCLFILCTCCSSCFPRSFLTCALSVALPES